MIEELISGVGLDYILENAKPDHARRLDILRQICDGLSFLHSAHPQIIHRDLKPSNVMVTDDGVVKIIDYDAAKPLDDAQERDTVLIGTHGSAAPEQYGFGKCDVRTDIYGLGGLIRVLFDDDPQMMRIADKATQLDPAARYQTVEELCVDLPGAGTYTYTIEDADKKCDGNNEPQRSFRDRIWPIPGFRTRRPWKMLLALVTYPIIGYTAFTSTPSNPSTVNPLLDTWLFRVTILGAMLSCVDVVSNWTGLFLRFPLVQNRNPILKVAGWCAATFIVMIGWGLIYAIIAIALGLT